MNFISNWRYIVAKNKTQHRCSNCGHVEIKWMGKCPQCNEWNTLMEENIESKAPTAMAGRKGLSSGTKPVRLKTISVSQTNRIKTGINEFDRMLGGGIVKDSVNVLTAQPGAGKSSIAIKIVNNISRSGHTVLYVSGEESDTQIKGRADRICGDIDDNLWIISETCMNRIEEYINEINPDLIVIDSIQTMYLEEINSRPGSPTQVNESTYKIVEIAKNKNRPRSFLIIAQQNKNEQLAGQMVFEHAVDAVIYLEGDRGEQLRKGYCSKNRYGDTSEISLFIMTATGLEPIDNPSQYFATQREIPISGSALTVTREGSRNFIVEIESLISKSYFGFPSRRGIGINRDLLEMLVEILGQKGGLSCYDKNVSVMVTGGLKLSEPAVNLGVIMSMVSSYYKKPIPNNTVFIGEVGLTGELKIIPNCESRVKELSRLGFASVVIPKGNLKEKLNADIKIIEAKTLNDVIVSMFGNKKELIEEENSK
ncbi:MAG: radA [Clostridiaceae bacterium]|jgi:DNA repair protein RadA/Sms|nr:radA [Clostridiaceae bacterium]